MAYCTHCGHDLSPQARACPNCGRPTQQQEQAEAQAVAGGVRPMEGFAIASVASAIGGLTVIPFVGSILGVVFGHIARAKLRDHPERDGGRLATAGLVIGWVGIGLAVLAMLLLIAFFAVLDDIFEGGLA